MARVTEHGISGLVGNLIFYSVNGKNYIRSRPQVKKRKKNAKMKSLNTIFGTVSKHGSAMIKAMNKSFLFPVNRDMYNRVRGWMRGKYAAHFEEANWEFSARNSGMCQLNPLVDLRDFLKTELTVTDSGNGNLVISLPDMITKNDFNAPLRTMKVNIKLIAVTSPFRNDLPSYNFCTEQYSFIYNNDPVPAQSFRLQTKAGPGDIGFVVVALEYETTDSGVGLFNKEMKWLPAAIVAMGRFKA